MNCKVFLYKSFPSSLQVFSLKKHTKVGEGLHSSLYVVRIYWLVAQSAEHSAVNRGVVGSSPTEPAQETKFLYNNSVKLESVEKELFVPSLREWLVTLKVEE